MQIMNDMLSSAGYEVIKAVTGDEGVAMAESHKPDLILMDVMLPGLDGYQATRRIKDNAALRHIPVIAVTSYALDGEESKAEEAGCDAYFSSRSVRASCLPRSENSSAEPHQGSVT